MKGFTPKVATNWSSLLDDLKQSESLSSDAKLATSLGVTRGYICSVRKGRKGISLELATKILGRLDRTFQIDRLQELFVPAKVIQRATTVRNVKDFVISRANGRCELCENPAPFETLDGRPYLEIHHVIPVVIGGTDLPNNLVALCPNCHRKIDIAPTADELKKVGLLAKRYTSSTFKGPS